MPLPVRAALLSLVLLAACGGDRRGDPDLQIDVSLEPDPPLVGLADVQVELADVDWRPRNGDRVLVTALRDSIVLAHDTAVGQGAGIYRAEGLRFEVAGDWLLRIRVETRDGRWTELDRPVEVETPPAG